ncbi:MAG TPA: choline kinase family protein [Ktedonobacteraceae bacterium]|jgi:thiamine kinase-like enzyme
MGQQSAHILQLIPEWSGTAAVISALEGGITNQNYRVDIGQESFVLRVGGKHTHLLGIERERERLCTTIAAHSGIGPEVVACRAAAGAEVLVTRFIAGTTLSAERASSPALLPRIVAAIKRYHDGAAFPGSFSPFVTVQNYHRLALERGVALPATLPHALHLLAQIAAATGPQQQLRPCHNDLLAGNFIDEGHTLRIVDWEYAGMGDLFFDLGNFAANQALDEEQCALLLRLYFGQARPAQHAHLHLMRLASDLRESLWGFLQLGISELTFDYREYAHRHLQRFLHSTEDARFAQWLQAVQV